MRMLINIKSNSTYAVGCVGKCGNVCRLNCCNFI